MEKKHAITEILTTLQIESLLRENRVEEAYDALINLVEKDPNNSNAWYLLGGIYRRQQLWGEAINAYNKAKLIDPQGPAATAIDSIYDILRFVNTDLMNP